MRKKNLQNKFLVFKHHRYRLLTEESGLPRIKGKLTEAMIDRKEGPIQETRICLHPNLAQDHIK